MIERYTRKAMGDMWTLEKRFEAWLEVELAVCEAWREQGRISDEAMRNIRSGAGIDVERILEIEETTRHDVIAFLTMLEEKIGPDSRFIHLGCTSSDIIDTANAIMMSRAGELIIKDIDGLLDVLKRRSLECRGMLCMGRTHGIHAEPTSFALKLAGFYAEFSRHKERFAEALENIRFGKLSGAVGTYAFLPPEVEKRALDILGLQVDPHSTQIIQRDRHAHYFSTLAVLAGGVERLCLELRHLQRTEVGEAEEGFAKGQKGSSAMPHKKNPISAENMCGLSRLVRTNALAAMENQALWHERDISHSSVERVIMPDSTILVDYILTRLTGIMENLVIKGDNMLANMERSFGLFYSQRVLTALVDAGMERQKAYVLVQSLAMQSFEARQPFEKAIRANGEITSRLDSTVIDGLFDPRFYLAHEGTILDRVFNA